MKPVIECFGLIAAFIICSFSTVRGQQDSLAGYFDCVIIQDSSQTGGVPAAPSTGVAKGVAIYASYVTTPTRPTWWARIWDSTVQLSVPKFYKDNSLGQYSLQITPFSKGSSCFVSEIFPDTGTFGPPNGGAAFTRAILDSADKVINFADFDANGDNIVDAVFLIIVNINVGTNRGSTLAAGVYETKDSSATGPIRIIGADGEIGGNGAALFALNEAGALNVSCHEWGHVLGLDDFYGGNGNGWWGLGGFSIMGSGFPSGRAVPFDPYNRSQLGWVTPTEVTAPLYQKSIADYLTTGTVYKLTVKPTPPVEYFLVTNHRGVNPIFDQRGQWEEFFQGNGLLIWHVDNGGAPRYFKHKRIDLEAAHGLWNLSLDNKCRRTDTIPNPVSGKDSLDCGADSSGVRFGYPANRVQSPTCFWNGSPKTTFDGLSNPTSAGYRNAGGEIFIQDVPTHLATRRISAALFQNATADLLVNNWYGHITANTTWGPNKVFAITGDITVDSGYTLTIDSGTTVYLQNNEDNQKAGVDTNKIEIRVVKDGKLIVNGKPNFPVKFLSSRSEALAGTDDWRGIVIKPGGYISMNNTVIRHAYIGIEDSSKLSHTIQNVRIGRCKMNGILAANTDSLTIRGCRADSINSSPAGVGFSVVSATSVGARLVGDSARACWYGIQVNFSATPVESCWVVADSGALVSNTGIYNYDQGYLAGNPNLSVKATDINGYFTNELFHNSIKGRVQITDECSFLSSTGSRTPNGIRSTAGDYLKLRGSVVLDWGANGIITAHYGGKVTALGTYPTDKGNNSIYTSAAGSTWKYVYDVDCSSCSSPIIKAEWNQWNAWPPSSSRFSPNVDFNPYMPAGGPKVAADDGKEVLPKPTDLFQNYPNPFNPTTLIQFNLEKAEKVNLEVFNILGQRVRTLLPGEEFAAGPYTFLWDGRDDRGGAVSSGMYIYRLQTPTYLKTKKMMLVK